MREFGTPKDTEEEIMTFAQRKELFRELGETVPNHHTTSLTTIMLVTRENLVPFYGTEPDEEMCYSMAYDQREALFRDIRESNPDHVVTNVTTMNTQLRDCTLVTTEVRFTP